MSPLIDDALNLIEADIQEEGRRVLEAVRGAVKALAGRDRELAGEVIAYDDEIDELFIAHRAVDPVDARAPDAGRP